MMKRGAKWWRWEESSARLTELASHTGTAVRVYECMSVCVQPMYVGPVPLAVAYPVCTVQWAMDPALGAIGCFTLGHTSRPISIRRTASNRLQSVALTSRCR